MLTPAIFDIALTAFVSLFVIIDPLGLLPIFIGLTQGADAAHKRKMAFKGVLIGGVILVFFALLGDRFLELLGVGLPAFRIAGGVMLFLIALEMVFDKRAKRRENKAEELKSSEHHEDIAVFPLAIPLISGPGAIATVMLLMSANKENIVAQSAILMVLAGVLLLCLTLFLLADKLERFVGDTITHIISRVLGIVLAALAIQYILDGLKRGLLS
ncbi:MarC family protein [Kiloniella litopenaei]|uniref:MarC family protein n=1 Tax=Kiloniella litopenaei TaxID=1549748 RepID=UPI000697295D|nr:MarC family protein [Kiloniella litopenaei]